MLGLATAPSGPRRSQSLSQLSVAAIDELIEERYGRSPQNEYSARECMMDTEGGPGDVTASCGLPECSPPMVLNDSVRRVSGVSGRQPCDSFRGPS